MGGWMMDGQVDEWIDIWKKEEGKRKEGKQGRNTDRK